MHGQMSYPYVSGAAASLPKHFVNGFHQGITVTCPGFYGPQGRVLRLGLKNPNLVDRLTDFRFGQHRITNFEMETSAIYGLGRLMGHNCLALNAIVANRVKRDFSKDGKAAVEKLIVQFLETFVEMN
jgi:uridine phosphorylase